MTKDNTKAYGMQEYLVARPCLRRMRCTAYLRVNGLLDVEAGLLDTKVVDVVAAMVRSLFRLCSAIEGIPKIRWPADQSSAFTRNAGISDS
ncbi:DUF2889 domain-containing protein [Aromatoleum toluolicum]|uniref:Transposase n=1 Tax=Aromatoleum toluolicum TaxID=90060 RepID=A0ABX1NB77_9RHOO|nr:hypothetical protein [Aromatoleum toluolicum]NMF96440.1 DUF2889 domain-containing protein [Aromatoleum toluolicum]